MSRKTFWRKNFFFLTKKLKIKIRKKNVVKTDLMKLSNSLELAVAGYCRWMSLKVSEHHVSGLDQATVTFRNESLAPAARNKKQMQNEFHEIF